MDEIFRVYVPTFMTIAEDMSYDHGPMISKRTFDDFVAPCYRTLLPRLHERGIPLFMDTDGDVTLLVPWLEALGIQGVLPPERQAVVDGLKLRQQFSRLRMVGHFNKMTMNQGEAGMRDEFERLVPLTRTHSKTWWKFVGTRWSRQRLGVLGPCPAFWQVSDGRRAIEFLDIAPSYHLE